MDDILSATRVVLSLGLSGVETGFTIAEQSTKLGFKFPKLICSYFGLEEVLEIAEELAIGGISIGRFITTKSISTISTGVENLHDATGGGEALRLLKIFNEMVKNEYSSRFPNDPPNELSHSSFLKGAITWAALQSITKSGIDNGLEEIEENFGRSKLIQEGIIFNITSEEIDAVEEIIEAVVESNGSPLSYIPASLSEEEIIMDRLKSYSKLCLGSYGVAGSIFFGVKLPSLTTSTESKSAAALDRKLDEENLANAFEHPDLFPAEGESDSIAKDDEILEMVEEEINVEPSIWSRLFRNEHDTKVLEDLGSLESGTAEIGQHRGPRFFVVTNHSTKTIQVIVRGTLSLDDIATDLSCESLTMDSSLYWDSEFAQRSFSVHAGMFRVAAAMGSSESTLTNSVEKALLENSTYELHLIGHSLGAGIVALLGTIWTNPNGISSSKSPIPTGRKVQVYGLAPPCTCDAELSKLLKPFTFSFVNSVDAVPRFSLGHIRDIKSASSWITSLDENSSLDSTILARILKFKLGNVDNDKRVEEQESFDSLRIFLESKMICADLFSAGTTYLLAKPVALGLKDDSLQIKLYRVLDSQIVFKQMIFSANMISDHLPHNYMQAIHTAFE